MSLVMLELPNRKELDDIRASYGSAPAITCDGNLLIKGDNLEGMCRLLPDLEGKIDLVYIDPPYNTGNVFRKGKTKANAISIRSDEAEAYNDDMPMDEYLMFIRERLMLIWELLSSRGTLYLHIDVKMGHYVKIIADEVFGMGNFLNDIARIKCNSKNFNRRAYGNRKDMVLVYAKCRGKNIWNDIKIDGGKESVDRRYNKVDENGRVYHSVPVSAPGKTNGPTGGLWRGRMPPEGRHWMRSPSELDRMDAEGRIEWSSKGNPRIKMFLDEYEGDRVQDIWLYRDPVHPTYPTEKNADMLDMIIRQSTDTDSIVMDCFAGSGSTLKAAQRNGRRWIGMDGSAVAIATIRERLDTDYMFVDMSEKKDG